MTDERSAMHGWAALFMATFKHVSGVNEFVNEFGYLQTHFSLEMEFC